MKKLNLKVIIVMIVAFLIFFIRIIDFYKYTKITDEDLNYITSVYETYKDKRYKNIIVCDNGNEYNIKEFIIDEEQLDKINKGDKMEMGIFNNEIVELKIGNQEIITLEECRSKYMTQINKNVIFVVLITITSVISIVVDIISKREDLDTDEKEIED